MAEYPIDDEPAQTNQNTSDQPRERQRRTVIIATLLVVVLVAGVITGIVVSRSQDSAPELVWTPVDGGIEETTLTVPIDHDSPDAGTLDLRVLRRPADDPNQRIGSLLVNPGGPGFSAEILVVGAEDVFETELLTRFDIVGVDPRGTGKSMPAINCIDDYDAHLAATDLTPDNDEARAVQTALVAEFAESCVTRTGDAIVHMSTASTARDFEVLRRALGEDTITYFGFSYGCELGATWATLFPDTVRAAVLDGCTDPTADLLDMARQQGVAFQASVETFLATCLAAGSDCPIPHDGEPVTALRELWARAADGGIPSMPGRPVVNESILQTAILFSMYSEDIWPTFAAAIAMGLEGDGSVLRQLADAYYERNADGTWGNSLEAFQVITCVARTNHPTDEQWAALSAEMSDLAPLFYPDGSFFLPLCNALPAAADEPVTITGAGTPMLLVIGNTGDPATPFASTERMAAALESAVLVAVESNSHGGYGTNACVNDTVHGYLIDGVVPAEGTRC
jgi:pimeloyl-ACP methyl ester carboxylesterase